MAWCLVKHRDNFTFTLPLNLPMLLYENENWGLTSRQEHVMTVVEDMLIKENQNKIYNEFFFCFMLW
jgi:hypothetical protein